VKLLSIETLTHGENQEKEKKGYCIFTKSKISFKISKLVPERFVL